MSDKARCILGTIFGLIMGLLYGLVSQTINLLALPGVPLYYAEPGITATILLFILGGGLMGLITAWPMDSIPGAILGSLMITVVLTWLAIRSVAGIPERAFGLGTILFLTFLPRVILFLPVTALIRWVLSKWETEVYQINFSIRTLVLTSALLGILAVGGGIFSLYPVNGRYALKKTHELVQQGLQSSSSDQLPTALKPVDGFLQRVDRVYSLRLSDDPDLLPVQRPMVAYNVQEYAVFVLFQNGYRFGCAFTPPHPEPSCGNY